MKEYIALGFVKGILVFVVAGVAAASQLLGIGEVEDEQVRQELAKQITREKSVYLVSAVQLERIRRGDPSSEQPFPKKIEAQIKLDAVHQSTPTIKLFSKDKVVYRVDYSVMHNGKIVRKDRAFLSYKQLDIGWPVYQNESDSFDFYLNPFS